MLKLQSHKFEFFQVTENQENVIPYRVGELDGMQHP